MLNSTICNALMILDRTDKGVIAAITPLLLSMSDIIPAHFQLITETVFDEPMELFLKGFTDDEDMKEAIMGIWK